MRKFTDPENIILQKLVTIFQQASPDCLAELQVARLLHSELDVFALSWTIEPKEEVTIYIPQKDVNDDVKNDKTYFDIVNFIYFLEELEEIGFIRFQNIPSSKEDNTTILFDKKKYKFDTKSHTFWQKISVTQTNGSRIEGEALISLHGWRTIKTDFAKDLQRCALSIVYPMPLAIDYVNNGYKTIEQRQFETEIETALNSAKSSRRASIYGFMSTIIACLTLTYTIYTKHDPTAIDDNSLHRIESAIESNHISEPIEIVTNDTLIVKPATTPPNIKK